MQNIAGYFDCDKYIARELERCQIPIVEVERNQGEVAYTLIGRLGDFEFRREWNEWVVFGPLFFAPVMEVTKTSIGKTDIKIEDAPNLPGKWVFKVQTEVALYMLVQAIKSLDRTQAAVAA